MDSGLVLLVILDDDNSSDNSLHSDDCRVVHRRRDLMTICPHCKHNFGEWNWSFIWNEVPCPECKRYFDEKAKQHLGFNGEELVKYEEKLY
jgi:ribosomal protein L36